MKPYVWLMCVLLGLALNAPAQDSLVALAERQQWEERFTTLNTRIDKIEEAIALYQQRANTLAEEIHSLREDLGQARKNTNVNAATQKSLELLADAIKEVDRKRMADNEKVLNALTELQKGLLSRPALTRAPSPSRSTADRDGGYEYTVQAGDNSAIIAAKLKKNGVNVTPQQIIDANPGIVWTKLRIGQKLFIPGP